MSIPALGFRCVKVVALSVRDRGRAHRFYGDTLALAPAFEGEEQAGYLLGETLLMLKDDYARPTDEPNPRITLEVDFAPDTEKALKARGIVLADNLEVYEGRYYVGSFLDSEGNKLWFCSGTEKEN